MASAELNSIALKMVARKKGILAADESTGTMTKRLDSINVESTSESRRQWRQLLFQTPDIGDYISGVIMYDETLRQSDDSGKTLVELLADKDILSGIKVDNSTHDLAGAPGEFITEGLDGLRGRLAEYYKLGARFTKWRALITIGEGRPSDYAINTNMHALARYSALCQEQGLVPIVEPEIFMDGTHSIDDCRSATTRSLISLFEELDAQNVDLEGIVLKPNMVISGSDAPNRASAAEVARQTIDCFLETVPTNVPGIAFLSGGQDDEESVVNLDEINKIANTEELPWELTYSYGRGLQAAPLAVWLGTTENIPAAQAAFQKRGLDSSAAREGVYVS
ncbi:MAG: fructose-bisphosphate aldolase class I [Chloroflexi bacterium]|jgi:fructose-bisphosphate aldolase class I|nr:fructose-bisphosphate aldolase class I [Chloroflexota bacterium]